MNPNIRSAVCAIVATVGAFILVACGADDQTNAVDYYSDQNSKTADSLIKEAKKDLENENLKVLNVTLSDGTTVDCVVVRGTYGSTNSPAIDCNFP